MKRTKGQHFAYGSFSQEVQLAGIFYKTLNSKLSPKQTYRHTADKQETFQHVFIDGTKEGIRHRCHISKRENKTRITTRKYKTNLTQRAEEGPRY